MVRWRSLRSFSHMVKSSSAGWATRMSASKGVRDLLRRNLFFDANGAPADPTLVYATTRALHFISNVDVYLDSSGELAATSRFLIIQARDRVPRIVIGGRYRDSFGQGEEGLHFRRRIVEAHIVGDTEGYLTTNPWTA